MGRLSAIRRSVVGVRRGTFAATLVAAMACMTLPGYIFGVVGPELVLEFGLSRFELGSLTTVFFLSGACCSFPAGAAVDRFAPERVMLAAFGILSFVLVTIAMAPTYSFLLASAALAGAALATANPTTNRLVGEHVPPKWRGLVVGGKQAGVQLGALFSGLILAPAAMTDWRLAVTWSAVIPIIAIVLGLLSLPRSVVSVATRSKGRERLPSSIRWLITYAFLMGSGIAAVNAYLPLYLVESGETSLGQAGFVVALIGFVGTVSRIIGGWVSGRLDTVALLLAIFAYGAVVALMLMVAAPILGLPLALAAAALFGATAVPWNSVGMVALVVACKPAQLGRASGAVVSAFYFGFVASPVAFGLLVDMYDSYTVAWLLVALILGAAGGLASMEMRRGSLGG